ncbi:MAG: HAD-IIB family hydrolase [Desulfobacterales bacterium]
MRDFREFPADAKRGVRFVLTDIDDTLTLNGRLPAAALEAMERLEAAGLCVIPVTGRPAGWCDHIARMWPVAAVVGENGAFYFRYRRAERRMERRWAKAEDERRSDRARLEAIRRRVLAEVPGCAVAADQAYREADLAIDYGEDVPPLPATAVARIVRIFEDAGARAKVSSIHVNGWFGSYDKLSMTGLLFAEVFSKSLEEAAREAVFIGDSPNDQPMFARFPHSVGVANIRRFADALHHPPRWVTRQEGGLGFCEMAAILLSG